jgi:hypothetical protein
VSRSKSITEYRRFEQKAQIGTTVHRSGLETVIRIV